MSTATLTTSTPTAFPTPILDIPAVPAAEPEAPSPADDRRVRVARGARFLDGRVPEWWGRIYSEYLAMGSCSRCLLGQLFGRFEDGIHSLIGDRACVFYDEDGEVEWLSNEGRAWAVAHGFMEDDEAEGYDDDLAYSALRSAWLAEIARRRVGIGVAVAVAAGGRP